MGLYTTLFDFFHLINLKILNKAKIENFVFKQIKVIIPIKKLRSTVIKKKTDGENFNFFFLDSSWVIIGGGCQNIFAQK